MRASVRLRRAFRISRFESFEPRILLSVTSPSHFQLDYLVEDQAFAEVQSALGVADDLTGWSQARSEYGLSGAGQTVVIIDSGIAYNHVALGGGFGSEFRVVGGYDFAENDADPYDDGPLGSHGTHVAGILASTDFASPGVAAGVDLVALRVFDDAGVGHFEWVEQALGWVHDHRNDFEHPITTVNLSIGSQWNGDNPPPWATLEEELAQLRTDGILVTAAAGNGFTTYQTSGVSYPAASPYVAPASSVDPDGGLSFFSQRHDRAIAAPGRSVRSTVPDYVGNRNGFDDDFARYSGTSMAAPYLAGAGVLLRQAYEFAGYDSISPDLIYGIMRSTADLVYDQATEATYHRLNLYAALNEIMPEDDFGSSAESAHDLGQVTDRQSIDGSIERLNDRDFFQFTAARTGEATLSLDATHDLEARWELAGIPDGSADGTEITFSAVAGSTYVVGLGTSEGIGRYRIGVQIEAESTEDSGRSCGQQELLDYRISAAGQWIPLTATRDGIFTVEACFSHAAGDVDLQLFDANQRLIGGSYSIQNHERIDVVATAGQTLFLYAYLAGSGVNDDVDFRTTNMVSQVGGTVEVVGSVGDDSFTFAAGSTHHLRIDGVDYRFSADEVQAFHFSGGGGSDTAVLVGTQAEDSALFRADCAQLTGPGYEVLATGLETATMIGRGGADTAELFGSSKDDVLHATSRRTVLSADGHRGKVTGFERILVHDGSGGHDIARLYDSPGNDTLVATPQWAELSGPDFFWRVDHFDAVHAQARSGGYDVARLYDSSGNDSFVAIPGYARLVGDGFLVRAMLFDRVNAQATAGGMDRARLKGSAGDDQFRFQAGIAELCGSRYLSEAESFESVRVLGRGGADTAALYDSALDDHLEASGNEVRISSALARVIVSDFTRLTAYSRLGGRDTQEVEAIDFLLGLVGQWQ